MTLKRTLIILFSFVVFFIGAQQHLYLETRLGGCHEPLPTAYYIELDSTIDVNKLLQNDSLLVDLLNSAQRIYCSTDFVYLLRNIDSLTQDNFYFEYKEKRNGYNFIREEKWDNFYVKIAVVNHKVQYSELKWANPLKVAKYEYYNDSIHIKEGRESIVNYVYSLK